tara:strand:- start:239 stop:460 length:222 start_codon:yes stop_codon:yes gene_type:complete
MPYVHVSLYPGRSEEQKQEFAKAVTDSAVEILKTKKEHVIVVFDEKPKRELVSCRRSTLNYFFIFDILKKLTI